MGWWAAWVVGAAAAPSPNRAVIVGSNLAGPGQAPLRFADADAERMRDVLVELGGYRDDEIELLVDPDPAQVLGAIDRAAADLAALDGAPTRFLFYYSGHARSRTLTLGEQELPVSTLDERLRAVPAQQRLAVLDACQAGEPSAAKGVQPEAAFSFVSVAGLATAGTAVVASSTADELSQEADRYGGSTFTHHWVSGMRGAADDDHDGVITLDEAYGYAYHRTVVDTAPTAIGAQHPTLREERSGHGDWILARPSPASAVFDLPPDLTGAVTVVDQGSGHVVAEVAKLADDEVQLAVAAGSYRIVVQVEGEGRVCEVTVEAADSVRIDPATCAVLTDPGGTDKIASPEAARITGPTTPIEGEAEIAQQPSFAHRLSVTARGGGASYGPLRFLTGGAEVGVHLAEAVELVAGAEMYAHKEVLPPEVQLELGIYAMWGEIYPMHLGLLYTPLRGRVQPYAGAEVITVRYSYLRGGDVKSEEQAWGARLRAGTDVMVLPNLGFQLNAAVGGWSGAHLDALVPGTRSGALPQLTAGVVLAL